MLHSWVPQRSAAKAAEDKVKQQISTTRASTSLSPSPARSQATHSCSASKATPNSSASSSSDHPPPALKAASIATVSPQPTAASIDQGESSLSEESGTEEEEIIQLDRKSPLVKSSSSSHKEAAKPATPRKKILMEPIMKADDPIVQQSEPQAGPSATATPSRTSSKRSAARAAQNNIQRSYSDFYIEDQVDVQEATTPAPKKPRTSTGGRLKAGHKQQKQVDPELRPPSSSSGSGSASKPRSKSSNSRTSGAASQAPNLARRFQDDNGVIWELQYTNCHRQRYTAYRKCVYCVSRQAGDTCRFLGFRAFAINPATDDIYPSDAPNSPKPIFLSSPDADDVMELPSKRPLSWDGLFEAQTIVGKSLLPVLEAELAHAHQPEVLRRPREKICRQMCEFCATSIFSASWFCRRCGREYCPDCKDAIEHPNNIADPVLAKRLAMCDRFRVHPASDLVPLTRFDVALLEQELDAMRALLDRNKPSEESGITEPTQASIDATESSQSGSSGDSDQEAASINWEDVPEDRAGLTADGIIGSLNLRTFDSNSFDTNVFRREWAHGEPLLVRNVIKPMQHTWDPKELIDRYGEESCHVVRSDTDPPVVNEVSVGEFFSTFGKDRETKQQVLGSGSWKLKDWPPSAEFKAEFPELYEDFNRAVPAPEYTTREGVLNLGSCYPTGVIQPDLGPKMYNAWPASEGQGGNGTTRLHMDIADAVNIMLYASLPNGDDVPEQHQPGVAAWDIFRAEDADTLRTFLREEYAKLNFKDDPIHIQRFFISAPQRVKLWKKYGVRSWRIYQKAGEAVFIPAGCAHQVCNLTDCIKVAVDFVSPQNVERCFKLTAEFRGLVNDYKKAWKEDVLSLRTTLWYAWCTYREMDNKGPNRWAAEQTKQGEKEKKEMPRVSRMVAQGD
ncbi:uncharacterized protein UDID_13435 [Ustilago sp. UG-2017a]|nr:uncharacterized protein UDID_13435 [Ustilago sp. UG-2017a]